jgi:hypothetical protein
MEVKRWQFNLHKAPKINMAVADGQSISEKDWQPALWSRSRLKFGRKVL